MRRAAGSADLLYRSAAFRGDLCKEPQTLKNASALPATRKALTMLAYLCRFVKRQEVPLNGAGLLARSERGAIVPYFCRLLSFGARTECYPV